MIDLLRDAPVELEAWAQFVREFTCTLPGGGNS